MLGGGGQSTKSSVVAPGRSWAGFSVLLAFPCSWLPAPALSSRPHCCSAKLAADAGMAAAVLLIPVGMMSPNEAPWEISTEHKNLAARQRPGL